MALALGLGSLFNHSASPNVSFSVDSATDSIRYSTTREIAEGEELCIFYGHQLWFEDVDVSEAATPTSDDVFAVVDDGLPGLILEDEGPGHPDACLSNSQALWTNLTAVYRSGDADEVVATENLPFERVQTLPEDPEEETMDAVQTMQAWAVDIVDPRQTGAILKWAQQRILAADDPFSHLKRVRKDVTTGRSSLLLALAPLEDAAAAPHPPDALALPPPYIVAVPARAALTLTSLALKNSLWPTMYTPKRKSVAETWTRARVLWACEAVRDLARAALVAKNSGELPVASYVPVPHEPEPLNPLASPVCASDIRTSTAHPLRHSVLNVVRVLADLRATGTADAAVGSANGAHYLLTGLTLFATHEPCIMCAMALLHSRVRELVYVAPMPGTGGAGGAACVPALPSVNHRYGILRWRREGGWREWWDSLGLDVAPSVDA